MTDIEEFERMREQVQKRLKPSRYAHCMGVSQTAEQLARIYGADERAAAVAGLLHDWDKSLSFEEPARKGEGIQVRIGLCAQEYAGRAARIHGGSNA